jgi:hypothetical protein
MPQNEHAAVPGDVIETENGNRYVVLPNGLLAYLGNRVLRRSTGLIERTGASCTILGRVGLMPYVREEEEEADDIRRDWDTLRGLTRIPIPLPDGCVCGHDALTAVLSCQVHRVTLVKPDPGDVGQLLLDDEPDADTPGLVSVIRVRFTRQVRFNDVTYEAGQIIQRDVGGPWPHPLFHRNIRQMWRHGWVEEFVPEVRTSRDEISSREAFRLWMDLD